MQRPHEEKRRLVLAAAAKRFASHPSHKVRLDDIAAEARVGKGTLYTYFETKVFNDAKWLRADRRCCFCRVRIADHYLQR